MITQTVADEFGQTLPEWIIIQNPTDVKQQQVLEATLDKGEASTIALALEQGRCLVIIDEAKGRKWAFRLGLTVTGTLGVLAQAKKKGYIPALAPLIQQIRLTNFRLSDSLVAATLKEIGEE